MSKSKFSYSYSLSNEILEIRIKNNEKVIFREVAPINDIKKINNMLKFLDMKGYINMKEIIKLQLGDKGWIE